MIKIIFGVIIGFVATLVLESIAMYVIFLKR